MNIRLLIVKRAVVKLPSLTADGNHLFQRSNTFCMRKAEDTVSVDFSCYTTDVNELTLE